MAEETLGTKLAVEYETLRRREHELITSLLEMLPKIDGLPEERIAQVRDALFHADNPFLIVFVGPFSSGKSSLINALIGEEILPVGPIPTTDRISILRWGETHERVRSGEFDTVFHPASLLRKVSFVDTPGLESIFQKHEETTRRFLHRADLVLLVMLSTQAMTASTLTYLKMLQEFGKTVILVINQADLLSPDDAKAVRDYVLEQSLSQLGYKPEVWLASAAAAQSANRADGEVDRKAWEESGLHRIERYVDTQLGDVARLRQKLQTPLQIVQSANQAALEALRANQSALDQYQSIGENIERQLAAQKREQDRAVRETMELVNAKFVEAAKRGGAAIRDLFRFSNALASIWRGLLELLGLGGVARRMRGEYVRTAFEQFKAFEPIEQLPEVVEKLAPRLEGKDIQDMEDLVKYSRREIDALPAAIRSKVIGDVKPPQRYDREALQAMRPQLGEIEEEARVVETAGLERTARNTFLYLAAWEVVVIAVLVFLLQGGGLFDASQEPLRLILFLITLAVGLVGLLLLPLRGRWLATAYANRLDRLQARYVEVISRAADRQVSYGMQLRQDVVAPLTRLVEAQTGIQTEQLSRLQSVQQEIVAIERELASLGKPSFLGLRG